MINKNNNNKDKENKIGKRVIKFLDRYKLSYNYKNYTVIYLYFLKENDLLRAELENYLKKEILSDEKLKKLYEKYVLKKENLKYKFLNNISVYIEKEKFYGKLYNVLKKVLGKIKVTKNGLIEINKNINEIQEEIFEKDKQIKIDENIEDESYRTFLLKVIERIVEEIEKVRNETDGLNIYFDKKSEEIEKLKQEVKELRQKVCIDMLTGIYNRRYFFEKLENILESEYIEEYQPISIIFIDIDNFKKINDKYGHIIGDEVLKYVAEKLKLNIKNKDIVARYGGEEFIISAINTELKKAVEFAENLRRIISSKKLIIKKTKEEIGTITVSIGVAEMKEYTKKGLMETVIKADKAMYKAKNNGKNRVMF